MLISINNEAAIVFKGEGIEADVFAIVPKRLLVNGLDKKGYIAEGWAESNNAFQKIPRGTQVWPDLSQEASAGDEAAVEFVESAGGIWK